MTGKPNKTAEFDDFLKSKGEQANDIAKEIPNINAAYRGGGGFPGRNDRLNMIAYEDMQIQ